MQAALSFYVHEPERPTYCLYRRTNGQEAPFARPQTIQRTGQQIHGSTRAIGQLEGDIFRQLARELHPDREPDSAERVRKTALMQRVTVADKANDLLSLLELQQEIAQIGPADLDCLSEERITRYNKILNRQLRELEGEIALFEHEALMPCGARLWERPTPRALSRSLARDITHMRSEVKCIEAELEAFRDVDVLKAWLKTRRPNARPHHDFWR